MFCKSAVVIALFCVLVASVSSQFVNDECVDSRTNRPGICTLDRDCPSVQLDFQRNRRKPTLCSFEGNVLVVCCPNERPPLVHQPVQARPAQQPPQDPFVFGDAAASGIRRSQQKCEEYSKLATHVGRFTTLAVDAALDQVNIRSCSFSTGLIVGGQVTQVGEFPHMAVLGWTDAGTVNWNCGGTLISDRYVMTAGHCGSNRGVRPDVVRLGEQNLARTDDRANPQDFGVSDVIMHPDYRPGSHYNDIALIQLGSKVRFTKFIRPACLWQSHDVNVTRGVATGWGKVEFNGDKSDELMKVTLDFVSNEQCASMYEPTKRIRSGIVDTQMCAGSLKGGRDTCQGDSGGPIQVLSPANQCIFHVVGVTSFGRACAARNAVGVYTRVYSFLDWIETVVWP